MKLNPDRLDDLKAIALRKQAEIDAIVNDLIALGGPAASEAWQDAVFDFIWNAPDMTGAQLLAGLGITPTCGAVKAEGRRDG